MPLLEGSMCTSLHRNLSHKWMLYEVLRCRRQSGKTSIKKFIPPNSFETYKLTVERNSFVKAGTENSPANPLHIPKPPIQS